MCASQVRNLTFGADPSPLACSRTRSFLIASCLLLARVGFAQPACSINIGPDHTLCQLQTVQLQGPPGYSNYLWNTGALTQNITVGAAGDYWCQVSYPSGTLVTNGNFTAGNTGFSTQFTYNNVNLQGEGTYTVGTDPNLYHPQFSGTGNGNFLIVNAGWGSNQAGQLDCWCQPVTVCPNQTYTLSYRARTLSNATPARLEWFVDGVGTGPQINLPAFNAGWQTITQNWTTAPGQTSATLCLQVMSGDGVGDDFGIDDISVAGTIILRDTVHVFVNPLPVMNCGGPYGTRCINGAAFPLNGTPVGGTWSGAGTSGTIFDPVLAGLGNHNITYSFTDANGCSNSCTTSILVTPLPAVNCGNYGPFCVSAAPINLGGIPAGGTWSGAGVNANMFNPASAGVGPHGLI